ncbi:FliA/WhiG family RNA polymerase sigma factor [Halonatronum saccharophilum]|uniref:FliA/WhiG family RNA polymerase sigma factor n=1 Tax=Halonatronum saccharophilum TaxID=150060 RepID=UPI000485F5B2|nr:FliA/WhiG family RNA polymerase sigma factor [Halonatronum saccharophilum]
MKEKDNKKESLLWKSYKEEGSKKAKEELVLSYVPLVKHIIGKLLINLGDRFEFDDLLSYGVLGLIDAIDRFDPSKGFKFSTYAVPRIKGAIYDELRRLDWVPQGVRKKAKDLSRVYRDLEMKLGRTPNDEEVRKSLGLDKQSFNKLLNEANIPRNTSLEKVLIPYGDKEVQLKSLIKDLEDGPDQLFLYKEMKKILGEAIDNLPKKEKLVLALYYYEDLTLTEIGKVMDLSTARISQLHTKAIFRLRGSLGRKKDSLII